MLSFKPTFSLSTFTFIKRLFSYSSFSAIEAWSSVVKVTHCNQVWDSVLNLLRLEPAILISSYPDTQSSGICVNPKKQTCCLKTFTFGAKIPKLPFSLATDLSAIPDKINIGTIFLNSGHVFSCNPKLNRNI